MPMLESWGATRAIPLSTSSSQSQPLVTAPDSAPQLQTPQSTEMDLSCMCIWKQNRVGEALADVRQFSCQHTEETTDMEKCCAYIYEKTCRGEVSFFGLNKASAILTQKATNSQWEDVIFRLLVLLAPQLELASPCVSMHGIHSESLLCSLCSQFKQMSVDPKFSEDIHLASLVCLASLCSSTVMVEFLQQKDILSNILAGLTLQMDLKKEVRVVCAAVMSNICKGVHVSCEGCDASEECLLLLNQLSDGILEETCKEVLEQRICGLYLLVKRGSVTEHLMVEAQGIGEDSILSISDCSEKWNQLIRLL